MDLKFTGEFARLQPLLEDPHPGLATWCEAYANNAIVQRWNAHEGLIEFVRLARYEFQACMDDTAGTPTEEHFRALRSKADAVLAKGESQNV